MPFVAVEDLVVVVAGGAAPAPRLRLELSSRPFCIAADSGVDHAIEMGLKVDIAVGDFDSVSAAGLAKAESNGAEIRKYPEEKDQTDLELAMAIAADRQPSEIIVFGLDGGRFDHFLGNMSVLSGPSFSDLSLRAMFGSTLVTVVKKEQRLQGQPGELVSLLPMHGKAAGVSTRGLLYPLVGEPLFAGSSRGLSNRMVGSEAEVSLHQGTLLAVQPEAFK